MLTTREHKIDNNGEGNRPLSTVLDMKLAQSIRKKMLTYRKTDILNALYKNHQQLRRIPLSPICEVNTAQAFRDAVREDIVLNGVRFVGDHRMEAFIAAVKKIVEKYVPKARFLSVSDRIMRSCSRTHSGADSYFAVQELFNHPGLLVKPRHGLSPPPLNVTLGIDRKNVLKCRIAVANLYSIYRHDDIEQSMMHKENQLMPLVLIDTVIVETIEFTNNVSTRCLSIRSPEVVEETHPELRELFQ